MTTVGGWTFRRLTRADFPLLASWLSQPEVRRWWQHDPSPPALEADFGPSVDGAEPNEDWLALLDGIPVGLVQRSLVSDYAENATEFARLGEVPDGSLTLDYLLGDGRGTGRGRAMLAAFVARTWRDHPHAPAILVTVVAANRPSWRALEHAGFRRVGAGDLPPENPADDPRHYLLRCDRPSGAGSSEVHTRAIVLVEGVSDAAAVTATARVLRADLTGVEIRSMDGVTNIRRHLTEAYAAHPAPVVVGLCDGGEVSFVERALTATGHPVADVTDLESYGFFVCHRDLEDELLRALGPGRAIAVIDELGLRGKLETLCQQPFWSQAPIEAVLHRFCGVASGRKELLAGALASALGPAEVPRPLRLLLERLERLDET